MKRNRFFIGLGLMALCATGVGCTISGRTQGLFDTDTMFWVFLVTFIWGISAGITLIFEAYYHEEG